MNRGLTTLEAQERLRQYGYNELPSAKPKNVWRIAREVLREPMFILLIACSLLYTILGDYKEGIILLSTIFIIIGITFYQHRKTERSLEALRKLSSPRALVVRDGVENRIAGREVVPGDCLLLHEGDRIAADCALIESSHISVDESILTGESVPVTKKADAQKANLYSGTVVTQGRGVAVVNATGIHTQVGKIGVSLSTITESETRLQVEMKSLIKKLVVIGVFISISVVLIFYFSRGNFIQSLLNGLAASMAILPEEFPVVLTLFLALGSWRLTQKNVLTRKPAAIETLGSITVLCTDKTGTITHNRMEVIALYIKDKSIEPVSVNGNAKAHSYLLRVAHQACQQNTVDPMEQAIGRAYHAVKEPGKDDNQVLVREYPLSRDLLAMTSVTKTDQQVYVSTKGAPEVIFQLCQLGVAEQKVYLQKVTEMATKGYRVMAVAEGKALESLPESQTGFALSFIGLIGLEDPIRKEVPQAVQECARAGIRVIMITGDFPATAKSIAQQIGLPSKTNEIITGTQLETMDDKQLRERSKQATVFARIRPDQKLKIVQALKSNGEIVAMTGDGVNDAPALKAADIGVAMGNKGTDVAREASSLVLLDDNFASIVMAIRLGRRIFDNLQKAMTYIMAIHIPIIGLVLLPAFFPSLPILLLPLHIVFMELIVDPVCTIAFESEQDEVGIMNRPPRNQREVFFGTRRIVGSVFTGFLLLAAVLSVYFLSIQEGHTAGEVRAIAFSSLIISNIFLILTSLSTTRSFISVFIEKNIAALILLIIALTVLLTTLYVPALCSIFSFEFPGYRHFVPSLIGAASVLLILEVIKLVRVRNGLKYRP
jgi:Ca2+-transporting ATPase